MVKEIIGVFLKLGLFAFGGPAAHVALMEEEFVDKRKWLSKQDFLDLLGFTNLIPGPNSTEMAILIGWKRAGVAGLFAAGIAFIFPAMIIVMLFAFLYSRYSDFSQVQAIFSALKPIVTAIILSAFIKLSMVLIEDKKRIFVFAMAIILSVLGLEEVLVLLIAGLIYFVTIKSLEAKNKIFVIEPISLITVFLVFLKIGALLFGSGYVLFAFVQAEFVEKLGLLTNAQMIDAIAVGEFTPGPVLTTATFIGYQLHGIMGGLVATAGIFLPSFVLVLILGPIFNKLKEIKWISLILRGVATGSLALMAMVVISLSVETLVSLETVILFFISVLGIVKFKKSPIIFIGLGLLVGLVKSLFL